MYSKLKCSNKLVPIADSIIFQNWTKRLCFKRIKLTSMKWPVTYDFKDENLEESETLSPLQRFKRVWKVYFKDGCLLWSCHHRQRYGIDCSHIFHILSQHKELEEQNHHHISVQWRNTYYQVACLSSNNKQFYALEKAVKMLMLNERRSSCKIGMFNHLPTYNNEDLPIKFKEPNFPEWTNYLNLKVEPKALHMFEMYPFTSFFLQEDVSYDKNLFTDNFLFDSFFENENMEENICQTNKFVPYLSLIDTFKEISNHLKFHCCLEDIMEVRDFSPGKSSNQRKWLLPY